MRSGAVGSAVSSSHTAMEPREAALLTRSDDAVIGELMEWAGAVLRGLPKAG